MLQGTGGVQTGETMKTDLELLTLAAKAVKRRRGNQQGSAAESGSTDRQIMMDRELPQVFDAESHIRFLGDVRDLVERFRST